MNKKINTFKALLLPFIVIPSLFAIDNTPYYSNEYAFKTKEVMMLSQLASEKASPFVYVTGAISGKRGMFSFLTGEDPRWEGWVMITSNVDVCLSEDDRHKIEISGYKFKSTLADGMVVAYREAVKELKNEGAKYIFV